MAVWPPAGGWKSRRRTIFRCSFVGGLQRLFPYQTLLEDLPGLEPAVPAPVASRKGWWRRRHGESDGARPDWIPTSERFLDPTTDRLMRVWLDRQTRMRHYVPEPR